MPEIERIKFSAGHVMGRSVALFPIDDWRRIILHTGEPTEIQEVPTELGAVSTEAAVVTATASGIVNPDPGIDVVRYDPKDYPYVYNIDHYTVIENLPAHPQYPQILSAAMVEETEQLNEALRKNVFIIGPEKLDDHHWSENLPEHIKKQS